MHKIGWLTKSGKWIECDYGDHYTVALACGREERDFEKAHVKVTGIAMPLMVTCQSRLTKAQERALLDTGLDPTEVDFR